MNTRSIRDVVKFAKELQQIDLKSDDPESLRNILSKLLGSGDLSCITLNGNELWYRAVKCDDANGHSNISRCLHPPNGSKHMGRAQLPDQPVLYASRSQMVAFAELGATVGDFVQISVLRPGLNLDIPCHVVGARQSYYVRNKCPIGGEVLDECLRQHHVDDPNEAIVLAYVDSVLADYFRKEVKESEPYNYKITAFFSERFIGAQGGVIYPSVQIHGGINLALAGSTVDSRLETLWTEVVEIIEDFGHGMYVTQEKRYSEEIDPDGKINWASKRGRSTYPTAEHGNLEVMYQPGWLKSGNPAYWRNQAYWRLMDLSYSLSQQAKRELPPSPPEETQPE